MNALPGSLRDSPEGFADRQGDKLMYETQVVHWPPNNLEQYDLIFHFADLTLEGLRLIIDDAIVQRLNRAAGNLAFNATFSHQERKKPEIPEEPDEPARPDDQTRQDQQDRQPEHELLCTVPSTEPSGANVVDVSGALHDAVSSISDVDEMRFTFVGTNLTFVHTPARRVVPPPHYE